MGVTVVPELLSRKIMLSYRSSQCQLNNLGLPPFNLPTTAAGITVPCLKDQQKTIFSLPNAAFFL
jgi:hypothetical protein